MSTWSARVRADRPTIARGERKPELERRGHDQRVVDGSPGDGEPRSMVEQRPGSAVAEMHRGGRFVEMSSTADDGEHRAGGGSRVSTEYVSNAAWPARPRRRLLSDA